MKKKNQSRFRANRSPVHTTPDSFLSPVRPTVHTNPSSKRSFSKTLFELEGFENIGFEFSCGRKTF